VEGALAATVSLDTVFNEDEDEDEDEDEGVGFC